MVRYSLRTAGIGLRGLLRSIMRGKKFLAAKVGKLWPEDGPGPPSDEDVANDQLDWSS